MFHSVAANLNHQTSVVSKIINQYQSWSVVDQLLGSLATPVWPARRGDSFCGLQTSQVRLANVHDFQPVLTTMSLW